MKATLKSSLLVLAAIAVLFSSAAFGADTKNDSSSPTSQNAVGPPSPAAKDVPEVNASEYTIGTEDVLAINVWKEPEISRVVPVRPDGMVSVPLIGDVQAKSLTPKQLQAN